LKTFNSWTVAASVGLCALGLSGELAADPLVRIRTVVGDMFINLTPENAPNTVANFLNYTNDGRYNSSFIHRSAETRYVLNGPFEDFVIQGGGFSWFSGNAQPNTIPTDAPVANEFNVSNVRGTVAMAKPGNQPDGATSQWFINLDDRNSVLDTNTGGFTVFGTVDAAGMAIADAIADLSTVDEGSPFDDLPVLSPSIATIRSNLVLVESAQTFQRVTAPAAAILPASRSVAVGDTATAFATILNSSTTDAAASCSMTPSAAIAANFVYRQTNPATNQAFGPNNPLTSPVAMQAPQPR